MDIESKCTLASPRRRWLRGFVIATLGLGVMSGLGWYYAHHLSWQYTAWRYNLQQIKKIPNSLMSDVDIPEDWIEHSHDYVQFCLPTDISYIREKYPFVWFGNDNDQILVILKPESNTKPLLLWASWMHPTQKKFLTLTQLRLEGLDVAASDFRWSMSRREARWHTFIIRLRTTLQPDILLESTEYLYKGNWEGILCIQGRQRYSMDLHCVYCPKGVHIAFSPNVSESKPEGTELKLDLNIIRRIMQNIEIDCGCLPDEN